MNWFNDHKTRLSGLVITVIGAAQAGLPVLQDVMSKAQFGVVTFVLGIVVVAIGQWNAKVETPK